MITGTQLSFLYQVAPIKPSIWCRDKHTHRREILSRLGECMNYSLKRETLVCLMALVMVTRGGWKPARTHKQKQQYLGQDCASSGGYATLSMIKERYTFMQSLYKSYDGAFSTYRSVWLWNCQSIILYLLSMVAINLQQHKLAIFLLGFFGHFATFECGCAVFLLKRQDLPLLSGGLPRLPVAPVCVLMHLSSPDQPLNQRSTREGDKLCVVTGV